jgi:hypothetical protein
MIAQAFYNISFDYLDRLSYGTPLVALYYPPVEGWIERGLQNTLTLLSWPLSPNSSYIRQMPHYSQQKRVTLQ